jgi:hypothetical protein
MWILATWGAIMPSLRKNCPADDPRTIQVRVRRYRDAVYFREHYLPGTVDFDAEIVIAAGTDYDARLYIEPDSLAAALSTLALDIDYTSFKDQTTIKHKDKTLHDAYYAVWRVLYDRLSTRKAFTRRKTTTNIQNRVMAEPERWTRRTTERTEEITWKRMTDLSDRELSLLFQDEPTDADLREIQVEQSLSETYENEIASSLTGPREISGHLDHTYCDHAPTKTARRRCRKAWLDVKNS